MNMKISGIVVVLLSIFLVLGINGCSRSEKEQSEDRTKQPDVSSSVQPAAVAETEISELTPEEPELSLPKGEYGRNNPFMPLVGEYQSSGRAVVRKQTVKEEQKKPEAQSETKRESIIRLNAVLGENAVLFQENGVSKTVSVGDRIAGMKVQEIRSGAVILTGEGGERTITLGEQLKVSNSTSK